MLHEPQKLFKNKDHQGKDGVMRNHILDLRFSLSAVYVVRGLLRMCHSEVKYKLDDVPLKFQ